MFTQTYKHTHTHLLNPPPHPSHSQSWEGVGQILRVTEGEVALEMRAVGNCPTEVTEG